MGDVFYVLLWIASVALAFTLLMKMHAQQRLQSRQQGAMIATLRRIEALAAHPLYVMNTRRATIEDEVTEAGNWSEREINRVNATKFVSTPFGDDAWKSPVGKVLLVGDRGEGYPGKRYIRQVSGELSGRTWSEVADDPKGPWGDSV